MLPLSRRMKKEIHRKIASAQDLILDEVYQHFPHAVLHGGTAIWRCHDGKRFSEDLDFYLPRDEKALEALFAALENKGFVVRKKRILTNSVYSELGYDRTTVRLEATFQSIKGHLAEYETADGNVVMIYTLTPEEFLKEKITTYRKRRKIRDLYDIFSLLPKIDDPAAVREELGLLIRDYAPPIDEQDLKTIILEGLTPTAEDMKEYIERKWRSTSRQ